MTLVSRFELRWKRGPRLTALGMFTIGSNCDRREWVVLLDTCIYNGHRTLEIHTIIK